MMMLALLCGGQGRLSPTMFDLVADAPQAAAIFTAAEALLGDDPRGLVQHGKDDLLLANHVSQLLAVTAVLAVHACIAEALPSEFAVAGYSVGEMAAWSIAGIWSPQEALRLTDRRARTMDAAGGDDGQLAYVRGLDRRRVEALAAEHDCAIAITNPGNLFVVGGIRDEVAALCDAAQAAGAVRAAFLAVRVASHTGRLSAAVEAFNDALTHTAVADPRAGRILLAGGNGARIFRAQGALQTLAAQVANPIDWAATLEALVEVGVDRVLDLGPGHALADLARGALPQSRNYAADEFHSLDGLRAWIASA